MPLIRLIGVPLAIIVLAATASLVFAQQSVTVNLRASASQTPDSGVNGTATLTDIGGGRTRVVIQVTGGGPNMPVHFHPGRCPGEQNPIYPLQNIINGSSTSEIDVSLSALLSGTFFINAHRSPQEAGVWVSCGNVVAGIAAQAGGVPGEVLAGSLAALGLLVLGGGLLLRRRAALQG